MSGSDLPSGTVTFLFTDIEESTKLWDEDPGAMREALGAHNQILHAAVALHGGIVFKTVGDAFWTVFPDARAAMEAALGIQQSLFSQSWPTPRAIRVRIAIHSGEAQPEKGDYFGPSIHIVSSLLSIGRGGQTLVSSSTQRLLDGSLPQGATLRDFGEQRLRGLSLPVRLFQLIHPSLPKELPLIRSIHVYRGNLPLELTSFVGRAKELAQVEALLSHARLLTLTGAGGIGKTRLALKLAAGVAEGYPDGIWLVELATLSNPSLLPQAAASVLNIHEEQSRPLVETLADYFYPKTALLVLDGCEHLVAACASLAKRLLIAAPGLRILATSREPLGVDGEATWRVPSLAIPSKSPADPDALLQSDAAKLFLERAKGLVPSFRLNRDNAPWVTEICRQLDGIPLAIELAAARLKMLSPEQIAFRLKNRFQLLTGGQRTALPRHQTLQATIDWSYLLLQEQEQRLFKRLSAFAGGSTLEAAHQVCTGEGVKEEEFVELLARLVDKSLILVEEGVGEEARYRMLETIQGYGRERLLESGESPIISERHAAYFLKLAQKAEGQLTGPEQGLWMKKLEVEYDNLLGALEWIMRQEQRKEMKLLFGAALWRFWSQSGRITEGRRYLDAILSDSGEKTSLRSRALRSAGILARAQADYTAALELFQESFSISSKEGDEKGTAQVLLAIGLTLWQTGNYRKAREVLEESLELFRELGDKLGTASALNNLGLVARAEGDSVLARARYQESLTLYRELQDQAGIAVALNNLGQLVQFRGNPGLARALLEESLLIVRKLGEKSALVGVLHSLGLVLATQGHLDLARPIFKEGLEIGWEIMDKGNVALLLEGLARIACAESNFQGAARLLGAAEALRNKIGSPLSPEYLPQQEQDLAAIRDGLGEEELAAALNGGKSADLNHVVRETLST